MHPLLTHESTLYRAKGCKNCGNTGYKGRASIYEIIDIDERLTDMIHEKSSEQSMRNYIQDKTDDLITDALKQAISGITTLEEVFRVVQWASALSRYSYLALLHLCSI